MLWNAKNRQIKIDGCTTDFISFGNGNKNLIIIPGVGEGLKPVKGIAVPFAFEYRMFAKEFSVFVFGRKNEMPKDYSTREMAADLHQYMEQLGIKKASVVGVSMGGMIAQHLAADYPESIDKLVLAVTLARKNKMADHVLTKWIKMAQADDYQSLIVDTAKKSYSHEYLKKYGWKLPLLTRMGKPEDFSRFITMANACLSHDAFDKLDQIQSPTYVIGGRKDRIVTGKASLEIAEHIKDSKLLMYEKLGHALYEETTDFNNKIFEFLTKTN